MGMAAILFNGAEPFEQNGNILLTKSPIKIWWKLLKHLKRIIRRQHSLPERDDLIWKQFLEVIIVKKTVSDWFIRLVWMIYESYVLHAESLRLVWTKYESYILHTSAVMYTF